ncbi:MAG: haloacid dehalogenase-like hydrolase, partial [Candidatus Omnitrophica bacterium]|nr:haloacid dehalogenase-like hydrolase [Candidatus Omnitrophota bacterium]
MIQIGFRFRRSAVLLFVVFAFFASTPTRSLAADPLPSWNDTGAKEAIIAFVEKVTEEGSSDYVPPAERIATFDNDGNLWCEQPFYFQLAFALDRVKEMSKDHPEWKDKEPFKSVLAGDLKGVLAGGEKAILQLVMTTHAGMTEE